MKAPYNYLGEIFGWDHRHKDFDQLSMKFPSPETIYSWSSGCVKNSETFCNRTHKLVKSGLFCEQIFGPSREWKCVCGKYKGIDQTDVICECCSVKVSPQFMRRENMGHIELAAPVVIPWFWQYRPSIIGFMLDLNIFELDRLVYYEDFVVTDPGNTALKSGQILTEKELREAEDFYGDGAFRALMGAEALQTLLKQVDLVELAAKFEEELIYTRTNNQTAKLLTMLEITQRAATSKSRPEWMILTMLPVPQPYRRPYAVRKGEASIASLTLHELYCKIINHNNRLKNMFLLKTPEVILRNEKRMLQVAVDQLFNNDLHRTKQEEELELSQNDGVLVPAEIGNLVNIPVRDRKALTTPPRRAGDEFEFAIAPGVTIVMCWIPPGEFLMGSPDNKEGSEDSKEQHRVVITKGFWLAKTPTTQAQCKAVKMYNRSFFRWRNLPVENMSWLEICGNGSHVEGFLERINKLAPYGVRFDLPTEAQWEYACRAGTTGQFTGNLDEVAWHEGNSGGMTHPVGQKKPNAWGLQDMLGNVWEWCSDWYDGCLGDAAVDPSGPERGTDKVRRGGCWNSIALSCSITDCSYGKPTRKSNAVGFRLIRTAIQ